MDVGFVYPTCIRYFSIEIKPCIDPGGFGFSELDSFISFVAEVLQ